MGATKVLSGRDLFWVWRKSLGSGRVKWSHEKCGRLSNGVQVSVSKEAGQTASHGWGFAQNGLRLECHVRARQEPMECLTQLGLGRSGQKDYGT